MTACFCMLKVAMRALENVQYRQTSDRREANLPESTPDEEDRCSSQGGDDEQTADDDGGHVSRLEASRVADVPLRRLTVGPL